MALAHTSSSAVASDDAALGISASTIPGRPFGRTAALWLADAFVELSEPRSTAGSSPRDLVRLCRAISPRSIRSRKRVLQRAHRRRCRRARERMADAVADVIELYGQTASRSSRGMAEAWQEGPARVPDRSGSAM